MDNFTNWAEFAVSQGYDAAATSVALSADPGAACPTGSANAWWWNATDYPRPQDDPNHEIVRMTSRAGATLTITRAQEGTSASTKNAAGKVYKIGFGVTAKTLNTDLPADITAAAAAGTAAAAKFPVDLGGANATGTLAAARMPALTGDVTTPGASLAATIVNSAVTNAKLANMANHTAKGRDTAGAGAPEDLSFSQMLDWISSTRGVILYRGVGGWVALAPGTSGNVLQTNGAGADPSWAAPSGGGGSTPTGTGFRHVTAGVEDGAAVGESGTGNVARVISPVFTTPTLGAAAATTVNKFTFTTPATGVTITIVDGKTLTVSNTITIAGTDGTTLTFQGTDTYVGRATTDTLTNKRITRRVVALTDAATVTPNADTTDMGTLATLSQATQFLNPTGTPTDGQQLRIRIKSTVARALTYDTQYKASDDLALPTLTTANKTDRMIFEWDSTDSKWVIVGRSFGGNP
jgi:hypothetical protein